MALAAALLTLPYHVAISETWMLVLSGRSFLAHGVHAMVDPFSYAAPNLYIEHEWLPKRSLSTNHSSPCFVVNGSSEATTEKEVKDHKRQTTNQ
jgi:hypothetical protein